MELSKQLKFVYIFGFPFSFFSLRHIPPGGRQWGQSMNSEWEEAQTGLWQFTSQNALAGDPHSFQSTSCLGSL